LLQVPLLPQWADAADAALSLRITSPSYPAGKNDLAAALANLGLLRGGPDGLGAALSIDRFVVRFREASWSPVGDAIDLTLRAEPGDLADVRSRLDAVDGDSQVILQLRCAKEDDSAATPSTTFALATQPGQASSTLKEEPRRQFALRVPVRPTARPSLNVSLSTLVFADPSYDRELSGPGPSDSQRDKDGVLWKVALDRFEYGTDTPVYFAFGPIGDKGLFVKKSQPPIKGTLTLQRQPARKEEGDPPKPQDLVIGGIDHSAGTNEHAIGASLAYGVTIDQLRVFDRAESDASKQVKGPAEFLDGDQIVVSIGFKDAHGVDRTLSVRAMVVPRPIIAPPPAVYALVAPFGDPDGNKEKTARVALHATAPLPQRIEFPDLLADLAIGHIRRRALFIWTSSDAPAAAPARATLVKIDRAGGGQLPERTSDLFSRLPLPS
jgi:hypothetical protein